MQQSFMCCQVIEADRAVCRWS